MGANVAILQCPASDMPQLSSLALDICPVPSYAPIPLIINDVLMSPNSSLHLSDHYRDVQNSLSPSALSDFTRRLRTTFGREGKVTMGGVGVVALALAVLFDTLAKEVKGQCVPQSGPIPRLFLQEPERTPHPPVLLVSDYLRLVPHIANNPARMREETEKYLHKLQEMNQTYQQTVEREGFSHVDVFNSFSVLKIAHGLKQHHRRLSNSNSSDDFIWLLPTKNDPVPETKSSFNCDLKAGNTAFKQEVLKSYQVQEELKRVWAKCEVGYGFGYNGTIDGTLIPDIEYVFFTQSVINRKDLTAWIEGNLVVPEEDFDLKAKSHLPF